MHKDKGKEPEAISSSKIFAKSGCKNIQAPPNFAVIETTSKLHSTRFELGLKRIQECSLSLVRSVSSNWSSSNPLWQNSPQITHRK
jgi:hypothetical protein